MRCVAHSELHLGKLFNELGWGGTEVFMGLEGDREIGVKREKV